MEKRIDFPTFRELLQALENTDRFIRVRMSGEGWMPFAKLILLSESAMILQEENERKVIVNLGNVVEFEIDRPTSHFFANVVYEVGY